MDRINGLENMSNAIISDNWSLQYIAELLTKGLDEADSHYIIIDREKDSHEYKPVASAIIYIESLFDFLTDIVLRDQIIVEEKFEHTWRRHGSPLIMAANAGVIRSFPFLGDDEMLKRPRDEIVNRLCVTSTLKRDHKENTSGWEKNRVTPNKYLSQTLWGGAGMLARGFVYEKGYTPHPVRKRFLIEAGIAIGNDAAVRLSNLMDEKRASIASAHRNNDELHTLTISIPPLPIRIIQESSTPNDLVTVALQIREEYQELRNWLRCYQKALSDGSYKDILKFQKILHSISTYIDSLLGVTDSNAATYTAGIGVFKIAMKGQPINAIRNQFGLRSMINELIVNSSGYADLKKLLGFFGHRDTVVGMKVVEHFSHKTV